MKHLVVLYSKIQTMLKDENGATMIEYSLMVAFIAIVVFAAVQLVGTNVNNLFSSVVGNFP